ncbi:MAG: hypothetical protein LBK58_16450 [Prevotellaceae bacterium]|nr:hypothetical protein [Prevotellaceae bacterium]
MFSIAHIVLRNAVSDFAKGASGLGKRKLTEYTSPALQTIPLAGSKSIPVFSTIEATVYGYHIPAAILAIPLGINRKRFSGVGIARPCVSPSSL